MYHPGHDLEDAGPAPAPGAGQDYAPLWAAMPGTRESLCEVGTPDQTQLLTTGEPVVALAHTAQAHVQSAPELTQTNGHAGTLH